VFKKKRKDWTLYTAKGRSSTSRMLKKESACYEKRKVKNLIKGIGKCLTLMRRKEKLDKPQISKKGSLPAPRRPGAIPKKREDTHT